MTSTANNVEAAKRELRSRTKKISINLF